MNAFINGQRNSSSLTAPLSLTDSYLTLNRAPSFWHHIPLLLYLSSLPNKPRLALDPAPIPTTYLSSSDPNQLPHNTTKPSTCLSKSIPRSSAFTVCSSANALESVLMFLQGHSRPRCRKASRLEIPILHPLRSRYDYNPLLSFQGAILTKCSVYRSRLQHRNSTFDLRSGQVVY